MRTRPGSIRAAELQAPSLCARSRSAASLEAPSSDPSSFLANTSRSMDRLDQPLSDTPMPRRSGATSRSSPYSVSLPPSPHRGSLSDPTSDILHPRSVQRNARSRTADDTGLWKHDRYDENASARGPRRAGSGRPLSFPRDPAETNEVKATGKLFIENLHWDVSEQDLKTLFEQIGPVAKAYIKVSLSALDEKGVVLIQVALGT